MDLSEEELLEQLLKQDLEDNEFSLNENEKDERESEAVDIIYDEDDLPEHACEYCQIYEKECMVQCLSSGCKKWFCNKMEDGFGSHAIIHMSKTKHKKVRLHPSNKYASVLKCFFCESNNLFLLGMAPSEHDEDENYICCRMMYCSKNDLKKEAEINYEEWQPLIMNKQILPLIVPEPSEFSIAHSRNVDIQQIFKIEAMRNEPIKDSDETQIMYSNKNLPYVKMVYDNGVEYINTYKDLIREEMIVDKMQKESFSQSGIVVEWGVSLRNKRTATFVFPSSEELGPSWFIGNHMRLKWGDEWSGKGVGLKIIDGKFKKLFEDEKIVLEMKRDNIPEDHNGKMITTGYTVEFIWNSVSFDRMLKGLNKFEKDHKSISVALYESILGRRKKESFIRTKGKILKDHPLLPRLNEFQKSAVIHALENPLTLIQGPPGTGKSLTIASIVHQLISNRSHKKRVNYSKIMVCAPSNNTVDNLAKTIDKLGISVVRMCSKSREMVDSSVEYLTLHNQVRNLDLPKFEKLKRLYTLLDDAGELQQREKNEFDRLRRWAEDYILEKAQVICCTCSASYDSRIRKKKYKFETVLIDEATQAIEPMCLLPMVRGARRAVIVGDNKQLGPVVISRRASNAGLKISLYERLVKLGIKPIRLLIQYRMHPELSMFSANRFYNGELRNGVTESERDLGVDIQWPTPEKPIFFWNVQGIEEISPSGTSYINRIEVMKIDEVITMLVKGGLSPSQIAVITTYKGQRGYLNQYFKHQGYLKYSVYKEVELASVDSFQGREKDIIIISTVRSNDHSNVGFLSDFRRLNVAVTRAKRGMVIIGNAQLLSYSKYWEMLLYDFSQRNLVFEGNRYSSLIHTNMKFKDPDQKEIDQELLNEEFPAFQTSTNLSEINESFTLNNHENNNLSEIISRPFRISQFGFDFLPAQKQFLKPQSNGLGKLGFFEEGGSFMDKLSINESFDEREEIDEEEADVQELLNDRDLMANLRHLNMDSDSDFE